MRRFFSFARNQSLEILGQVTISAVLSSAWKIEATQFFEREPGLGSDLDHKYRQLLI